VSDGPQATKETPKPGRLQVAERMLVDFFGARTTGETAALFRIAFGVLAIWVSIGVWLNLDRYFGNHGLAPWDVVKTDEWTWVSLFVLAPDSRAMLIGHAVVFSVAAVLYTLGVFPRPLGLLIGYINISLQFRNPFILNSGDRLFQIIAPLTALMPLGRCWSIPAWLRARRGFAPPKLGTVFGLRIVQIEVAYIYMTSFIAKISNPRWRSGIALRDVLSSPVFAEWPRYWAYFPVVVTLTYMTLAFESTFPLLVWFKRFRPWYLLWGIAFHVGIDAMMVIPMFSAIMIVCYAVYLTDAETRWLIGFLRHPVRSLARVRTPAPEPASVSPV
jgi:HTTM domain